MVEEWPKFEWHRDKAASNLRKYGVRFETAVEVFSDPAVLFEDDRYSEGEHREIAIGASMAGLLFVVFTERYGGVVRIISARQATSDERRRYRSAR